MDASRRSGVRRLAMAAVAVWVAVACTRGKTPPMAARNALADSADQVMYHAKSVLTDRGVMKAELYADTGYFFDDNTRIEMRVLTTYFFTATGARSAVLTSHEGTYNSRTGNMEARDSVVVVTEDKRRLTTPVLRYAQAKDEITSDSPFVLVDSAHRRMTGVGFVSDPNMNRMRCLRACAATAGVVDLSSGGDTARSGATPVAPSPSAGATSGPPPPPRAGAAPAVANPAPGAPQPVSPPPPSAGVVPPHPAASH